MGPRKVHSIKPTVRDQIINDLRRICGEALAAPSGREERYIVQELTSDADARARVVRHPNLVRDAIKGLPAFRQEFFDAVRQVRSDLS